MPVKMDDEVEEMLNKFYQCIGIPTPILNEKQAAKLRRRMRLHRAVRHILDVFPFRTNLETMYRERENQNDKS